MDKYLAKPDKTLLEHTNDVKEQLEVIQRIGYIPNDKIFWLTYCSCEHHDKGKVNREFKKRISNRSKFNPDTEIAHNVLSLYFIKREDFDSDEDYQKVAYAVLTHHNYCDEYEVIDKQKELIHELLADFGEEIHEVRIGTLNRILKMKSNPEAVLIKGLLMRCDYSASAGITVEYANDFLVEKLGQMMNAWQKKEPEASWNDLQTFCREHRDENIIVTAQTGMGKTEAGLLWMGNHKGFFILPLRTAINAIYARIKGDVLCEENLKERLALLHSDTLAYYTQNLNTKEIDISEYYKRTKQLSMPLTVTTLDQIFDFVFQYPGYEMKLATLSYTKIIIDEIQMYGPDLLAYLTRGIEMIIKYGGKVAVLTATLAPFVKDILEEKGCMKGAACKDFNDDMIRHNLKVYPEKMNAQIIAETYILNKKNNQSNKILVVCNTVNKAQAIYQELEEIIDSESLHILHNKFIKEDRSIKEEQILEFGKTYKNDNTINCGNGIWVATSIVEASLDIDFDFLFTELSDLSALFQRLGRCNRKGKKDSSEYNCFVFTEINPGTIRRGDKGFIDKTIHELSKEALRNVDGVVTESEKVELINSYFRTQDLKGSDYLINFNKIYDEILEVNPGDIKKNEINFRNILSYTVIPESVYNEKREEIESNLDILEQKDILWEQKIRAANHIRNCSLSVEPYIFRESKHITSFSIGRGEVIYVIDCFYDKLGFRMKKNDGFHML